MVQLKGFTKALHTQEMSSLQWDVRLIEWEPGQGTQTQLATNILVGPYYD